MTASLRSERERHQLPMFKVPVKWLGVSGDEVSVVAVFYLVPRVGESVDLSTLVHQVAADHPSEAKHLERMRVLAVEHGAAPDFDSDEDPTEPGLSLLLERDPESQHQLELEEKQELVDDLRRYLDRLLNVLNSLSDDVSPHGGKFALVPRDDHDFPQAPSCLLAFQVDPSRKTVPSFAEEMADVVYVPLPAGEDAFGASHGPHRRFRCVKHRYRDEVPFECSWTGV